MSLWQERAGTRASAAAAACRLRRVVGCVCARARARLAPFFLKELVRPQKGPTNPAHPPLEKAFCSAAACVAAPRSRRARPRHPGDSAFLPPQCSACKPPSVSFGPSHFCEKGAAKKEENTITVFVCVFVLHSIGGMAVARARVFVCVCTADGGGGGVCGGRGVKRLMGGGRRGWRASAAPHHRHHHHRRAPSSPPFRNTADLRRLQISMICVCVCVQGERSEWVGGCANHARGARVWHSSESSRGEQRQQVEQCARVGRV